MQLKRKIGAGVAALALAGGVAACGNSGAPSATQSENKTQGDTYARLVAQEPAHTMEYSPTRHTINKWIDTWGKDPNKLSYVYFMNAQGQIYGYYVLKGLPVSYGAAISPTQQINYDSNGNTVTNRPSLDGVYYSGGGSNAYYGFTADTGAYIEYTVGAGQNVLIYDQPLDAAANAKNLAPKGK